LQLGVRLFDTAEVYSAGMSEIVIGQVLKANPNLEVLVASKASPENLNTDKLIKSLEASLRRLQLECIAIYQVHWRNPRTKWQETAQALSKLVAGGKIKKIGVCNVSLGELQEFERALSPLELSVVQAEYNLFDRSVEVELLPYCQQRGKTFLAYSPLHQGHMA